MEIHPSLGLTVLNRMCSMMTWAIVAVYIQSLRKDEVGGHKTFLLNLEVFFCLRTIVTANSLLDMVFPVNSLIQNTVLAMSVACSLWTVFYGIVIRDDIRQSIRDSQLMNVLRGMRRDDKAQARVNILVAATQSRDNAVALLAFVSQ